MRRILLQETDFTAFSNPPSGFNYIGFNGATFSEKNSSGTITETGGGGGSLTFIEITNAEVFGLIVGSGVQVGARYYITGVDVDLYGGTDVIVDGLAPDFFSTEGWGKFYNPRYDIIDVWDSLGTYAVDSLVIYGGKVWKNLTGSVGEPDFGSIFLLNADWELQEDYDNIDHYYITWDKVELGISALNYVINSRYDRFRNNYVRVGQLDSIENDRWFYCGVNPLAAFGWGNNNINDCNIVNSYFNCLNIIGSTEIYGVEMSNYSFIFDAVLRDVYIEGLNFTNESGCYTLYLNGGEFRNIKLENSSTINNISSTYNCHIQDINLKNNSYFYDIELSVGSSEDTYFERISLDNNSFMEYVDFYNTSMRNIKLDNNSYINYLYATASTTIENINLLNNSYIYDCNFYSTYITNVNCENNSYFEELSGTSSCDFENININNASYISNVELSVGDGGYSYFRRVNLNNRSYINSIDLYNSNLYEVNFENYSYFETGNLWYSYFDYVSLDNHSRISNNIGLSHSELKRITMTNRSRIQNITLDNNSLIQKLDATNDTYISNLNFNNSYIEQLDSTNNSSIANLTFNNNSFILNTKLNKSNFENNTLYGSNMQEILLDSSYIQYFGLSNSNISKVKAFDSNMSTWSLDSSLANRFSLDSSQLSNIFTASNANLSQINMNSAYLNLIQLGTYSSNLANGTSFNFNELKYQFSLTFNGTNGQGVTDTTLNIPSMICPQDFYIDKLVIESSPLTYSGDSATFSFGFAGLSPSNVEVLVSDLSNKISVRDISNGLILGQKADSDKILTSYLTGGTDITSGGIKVEVTIKNTNTYNGI